MFNSNRLRASLEQHRAIFQGTYRQQQADLGVLVEAHREWANHSAEAIEAALGQTRWPGARPTWEQDERPVIIPFTEKWQHHSQARQWALSVLNGVTTFAVDGSHLMPPKEFSIPVGLVQVGWFQNHHIGDETGHFEKDVAVEIIGPEDFEAAAEGTAEDEVDWRRFQGEAAALERFLWANRHQPQEAVAFFDGSFILSFVQRLPAPRRAAYLEHIQQLLTLSEHAHLPLIGSVDHSRSYDFANMLSRLAHLTICSQVTDARLWFGQLAWGERSRFYRCARNDRLIPVELRDYYDQVVFTYLQTTSDSPPARIELPRWVLEVNKQDWVLDVIRAECVVGLGYPYSLASADAAAVISGRDRARFMQLFQQFAAEADLPLTRSRKEISKRWYRR